MNNLTEKFWNSWESKIVELYLLGIITTREYFILYGRANYHKMNYVLGRIPEIGCKTIWPYIRE